MNNLPGDNLTLGISKNDLAAAIGWLTFGSGATEWGNSRSALAQATEGLTAPLCGRAPSRVDRDEAGTNPTTRCARRHHSICTALSPGSDPGAPLRIPF